MRARVLMRRLAGESSGAARLHHNPDAEQSPLNDLGSLGTREQGAGFLALHAFARRAELPRPCEWRSDPEGRHAATRGQQSPVPVGPERMHTPAPEQWPADPGRAATVVERLPEICPVHAPPRRADLARPHALPRASRAAEFRTAIRRY